MDLPIYKLILASINMAILCLVGALLWEHCLGKHRRRSWATAFYLLSVVWLLLRGAFWTMTITTEGFDTATFYVVYWVPNPLQFANFLLLPMFYAQVLSGSRDWDRRWRIMFPIYAVLTVGMVTFMLVTAAIAAISDEQQRLKCQSEHYRPAHHHHHHSHSSNYSSSTITHGDDDDSLDIDVGPCYRAPFEAHGFRSLTIICFYALAVFTAKFGWDMAALGAGRHQRYLLSEPRALAALNIVLFVVFLSKGTYQLISALDIWYLPNLPLEGNADIQPINFAAFCLWDYLPTSLFLMVINARPAGGGGSRRRPNLPNYGVFREISEKSASGLDSTINSATSSPAPEAGDNFFGHSGSERAHNNRQRHNMEYTDDDFDSSSSGEVRHPGDAGSGSFSDLGENWRDGSGESIDMDPILRSLRIHGPNPSYDAPLRGYEEQGDVAIIGERSKLVPPR